MRSELTATQQAEHLAKRKELWGARADGGRIPPTLRKGFAGETESVTGTSKRRVNEAIARAERVPEDIRDEIRGRDMDQSANRHSQLGRPRHHRLVDLVWPNWLPE